MTARPIDKVLPALERAGANPRGSNGCWRCRGVCHDGDRKDSLHVKVDGEGHVWLKCFSHHCHVDTITAAIGLTTGDLHPSDLAWFSIQLPDGTTANRPGFDTLDQCIVNCDDWHRKEQRTRTRGDYDVHRYRDSSGTLVAAVVRYTEAQTAPDKKPNKRFAQFSKQQERWFNVSPLNPWPLYRLPDLNLAEVVVIFEGERAVDMGQLCHLNATTSAGSESGIVKTDWTPIAGCRVLVVADNDAQGMKYASGVIDQLFEMGCSIQVIRRLPGVGHKGDFVDWCDVALGDAAEPQDFRHAFWKMATEHAVEIVDQG